MYLLENKNAMVEFSIENIKTSYPEAIIDGDIDYKALSFLLARELSDIQDQLQEKDYQILRITQRLDKLEH